MANLRELTDLYRRKGYTERNANARVCQDIVLKAISESGLDRSVTVKGGVVMRSITGDDRRATEDLDLDFIRYSLSEDSIRSFVDKLNCLDGIRIEIKGDIEELSQQEYRGKRVYIRVTDDHENKLESKIDLGVHTKYTVEQTVCRFDVCVDHGGVSLFMNTGEQLFAEKLRSLLRFGPFSTRYKDIYDFCFLSERVDRNLLRKCIDVFIFQDPELKENDIEAVITRVRNTFTNRIYLDGMNSKRRIPDWLGIGPDAAFQKVLAYLESLK